MADILLSADIKEPMAMLARMKYDKAAEKKDIRKEIRKVITPARKALQNAARSAIRNDPRQAYKAIKIVTYRDANGGNISILNRKGAVRSMAIERPTGGASGIRRKRAVSDKTKRTRGYRGADRGFILRFINSGTVGRHTTTGKAAYRGAVSARNFFVPNAEAEMKKAADQLSPRLLKLIQEVSEGK